MEKSEPNIHKNNHKYAVAEKSVYKKSGDEDNIKRDGRNCHAHKCT